MKSSIQFEKGMTIKIEFNIVTFFECLYSNQKAIAPPWLQCTSPCPVCCIIQMRDTSPMADLYGVHKTTLHLWTAYRSAISFTFRPRERYPSIDSKGISTVGLPTLRFTPSVSLGKYLCVQSISQSTHSYQLHLCLQHDCSPHLRQISEHSKSPPLLTHTNINMEIMRKWRRSRPHAFHRCMKNSAKHLVDWNVTRILQHRAWRSAFQLGGAIVFSLEFFFV